MATSFTLDALVHGLVSRRAEAARIIATRPPIPVPRTVRRPLEQPRHPVRDFVGGAVWSVLLALMAAASVRVMFAFATVQGGPAVHVDETIAQTPPARATVEAAATPRQPSSVAANRTI